VIDLCHSEKSEESNDMIAGGYHAGFFGVLRMTGVPLIDGPSVCPEVGSYLSAALKGLFR
jgi:hypothetical protein